MIVCLTVSSRIYAGILYVCCCEWRAEMYGCLFMFLGGCQITSTLMLLVVLGLVNYTMHLRAKLAVVNNVTALRCTASSRPYQLVTRLLVLLQLFSTDTRRFPVPCFLATE